MMEMRIICLLSLVAQFNAYLLPDCGDGGERLKCLHICGWKSIPGRKCPQGKQCCVLKSKNILYQSIKDNSVTSDNEDIQGHFWIPDKSIASVPVFNWSPPQKYSVKHPWSYIPNKLNLPFAKFPWTASTERDTKIVARPIQSFDNHINSSVDVNPKPTTESLASFDNTLSASNKPSQVLSSDYKVILNPAEYIKPKMKPVKKSSQSSRKSVHYCEEYSRIVKRSVEATPLLPYVYSYTIEVEDCGPSFTPLIVGGKPVDQGEYPHMAALGYFRGDDIDYLCGGSLISDKFVMTAAHCSQTRWGPPVIVHLGSNELYSENATTIKVDSIVVHPDYAAPACYHDIALVKLAISPVFTLDLRPACLPAIKTHAQVPGSITVATGWGKLGFGRESSINLMKVSLKVIHNYKCQEYYKMDKNTPSLRQGITPSMMCASGYKAAFHDTCQGDSGGPLQSLKEGSKCMMEIVGITSFGKSCGTGIPAVYTRVATYLDWIESIVWQ